MPGNMKGAPQKGQGGFSFKGVPAWGLKGSAVQACRGRVLAVLESS